MHAPACTTAAAAADRPVSHTHMVLLLASIISGRKQVTVPVGLTSNVASSEVPLGWHGACLQHAHM
jgi:hypothetical protein